jgi:uncharacterized 2Fe-2S/4Fe-4S cluster protein (DUF4445 family)
MPLLTVTHKGEERLISFRQGSTVREILDAADIRLQSACGGAGVCGLCLIKIDEGSVESPTAREMEKIPPERIRRGIRLACQCTPVHDVGISIRNVPPRSSWRCLSEAEYYPVVLPECAASSLLEHRNRYGVAVDLGTTHVRLSLWDLHEGQRLAGRHGMNPQIAFGSDVLTRLVTACESDERSCEISQLSRNAIGEAIRDIVHDISLGKSCDIHEIGNLVIVGNTAMLTLLTRKNYGILLQPEFWMREIDCTLEDSRALRESWDLDDDANVEVIQPLAGFVGSDLLAGVLATRLTEGSAGALLIDFGTNSEVALWDGSVLWVTSTAGGPAFEGWGISCGAPAEPGAIYRIEEKRASTELPFHVIGDGEPIGLCGSALVDLIACLVKAGILNSSGRFIGNTGGEGHVILKEPKKLVLKKQDVDVFLRAKAAIGAGMSCLLHKAGMRSRDVRRICVCGAFGSYLNIHNAQRIGLIPDIPMKHIELCGNTALAGCELLLLDPDTKGTLASMKTKARLLNMSQEPEFEDAFIESLRLQPMEME